MSASIKVIDYKRPPPPQVRETEGDGKRSVRSLSGFRRDSEILFVPNGSLSSANSESPGCMCGALVLSFVFAFLSYVVEYFVDIYVGRFYLCFVCLWALMGLL